MVCQDRTILAEIQTIGKSGNWGCQKHQNIEQNVFKVFQIKFLAMHITNQQLSFDIYWRKFTK